MEMLSQLKEVLLHHRGIYVYGAQSMAYGAVCALEEHGISVDGYVVSSYEGNPRAIAGKPVILLAEIGRKPEDVFFVLAVPGYLHGEIAEALRDLGYPHFLAMDSMQEFSLMKSFFRRRGMLSFAEDFSVPDAFCAEGAMEIYVAKSARDGMLRHKTQFPACHFTVHAGAALDGACFAADFRDDVGENISARNRSYSELTVTYWAYRNRHPAWKGIAHYRRYFAMTERERALLLSGSVDVVLPLPFWCWPDTSSQYLRYNRAEDIATMHRVLRELVPSEAERCREILEGQCLYNYNMLIARAAVFDAYCAWMFPILERMEQLCGGGRTDRSCGYWGEILTSLYFTLHRDDFRILHAEKVWLT